MNKQETGNYPNLTAHFGTVAFIDPKDAGQKAYYEACRLGTPIKPNDAEAIAAENPEALEAVNVYQNEYMMIQKMGTPKR